MPPFFIFQGKNHVVGLLEGAPASSFYSVQESGWMTQELFTEWLKRFVAWVRVATKDRILLVDGHKSRVTLVSACLPEKTG